MLGQLIKYELRATVRYFVPILAAVLIFATLNTLFGINLTQSEQERIGWFQVLIFSLTIFMMIATIILWLVITVMRFYKNMLGDEGYLMFTLPVSTHQLILSKLIVACLWNIACIIISCLAIFIMFWSGMGEMYALFFKELGIGLSYFMDEFQLTSAYIILLWVESMVAWLLSVASYVLVLYLSMSIGQLMNEGKLIISFVAFIGINVVMQILSFVVFGVLFGSGVLNNVEIWIEHINAPTMLHMVMIGSIVIAAFMNAIMYFISHWLLSHRLNLA